MIPGRRLRGLRGLLIALIAAAGVGALITGATIGGATNGGSGDRGTPQGNDAGAVGSGSGDRGSKRRESTAAAGKRTDCPTGALPLPSDAEARAADAALDTATNVWKGIDTNGAKVVESSRAVADDDRGGQVELTCGRKAGRRTVVVHLDFPAMRPSASLSQGVGFVSRFQAGYRIWQVAH